MARISDRDLRLGRDADAVNKDLIFNVGNGATNARFRGNFSTKRLQFSNDGVNFFDIGTGDSEEAGLFNQLALNGMEAGMMTTFTAGKENWIRSASNMTLNGDGNYVPSVASVSTLWTGVRTPDSGTTGELWTSAGASSVLHNSPSTGEFTITDTAADLRNYTLNLPSGIDTGDLFFEFECKTTAETTSGAHGSDVTFHNMVLLSDGANNARLMFIREGTITGARQIIVASSAVTLANDLDTGASLRINVDWNEYHNYKVYKKGTILYIYVDDAFRGRVDMTTLSANVSRHIIWGTQGSSASAGIHVYRKFHVNAYVSSVETRALNYRGTFAYEGDGDPTSAVVPASTVGNPTQNYVLENNWVQWTQGSTGTVTETQVNTGLPQSYRQLQVAVSSQRHYQRVITAPPNDGGNIGIQARVQFSAMNLVTGTSFNMLALEVANIASRIQCRKVTVNTVEIGLASSAAFMTGAGVGSTVVVGINEINTYELRKVGPDLIQFLFNGKIQQEVRINEFSFQSSVTSNIVRWGNNANIGASDTFTWRFYYVRVTEGKDAFLSRSPTNEFIAIAENDDAEPYVSFSSDNITWTYPILLNDLGVTNMASIEDQRSGGYVAARVMLSSSAGSTLNNLAILYNASQGAGGLATEAVKTFTASELPLAPQNATFGHGLGVADDEIMVFGGTEFLVKDLDWTFNSANSITIVSAQVGVPYTVRRVGFSFDRSQDNSTRITVLESQVAEYLTLNNISFSVSAASSALTIQLKDRAGNDFSGSSVGYVGFKSTISGAESNINSALTISNTSAPITIPSGATLGLGVAPDFQQHIFVYALNNAGQVEIAVSANPYAAKISRVVTTIAITAGADSAGPVYSNTLRTGVSFRLLGKINLTITTPGVYATAINQLDLIEDGVFTGSKILFAHRNGSTITINTNNSYQVLAFNSQVDSGGRGANTLPGYDTTTNNWTVPYSGYYRIGAGMRTLGTNIIASSQNWMEVRRGASFAAGTALGNSTFVYPPAGLGLGFSYSQPSLLAAGDLVWCAYFGSANNSVSTLTAQGEPAFTFFSAEWIGCEP